MDVVNFNIPGGSRQAPYFKGTMIELNQSYELEQVVKQRVDVLEILGELGINIAKNRKKLTGFEKKLRGAEEEYEKKFTVSVVYSCFIQGIFTFLKQYTKHLKQFFDY